MNYPEMTLRSQFVRYFSAFLFAAALAGCAQKETTKAAAPPPAVPVTMARVQLKDVPLSVRSIGNVQAYQSVAIKSMVNAQSAEIVQMEQTLRQLGGTPLPAPSS